MITRASQDVYDSRYLCQGTVFAVSMMRLWTYKLGGDCKGSVLLRRVAEISKQRV